MLDNHRKYYYLVTGLPDIYLGQTTGLISFEDMLTQIKSELHPADIKKLESVFLPFDNLNLLNLCFRNNKPWHTMANYSNDELKSGIEGVQNEFPPYLYEFYDSFVKGDLFQEEYIWEYQLSERFFEYILSNTQGFLHQWYHYARDLRNILAALSARYHGYSIEYQLVGNNEVTDKLRSGKTYDFNLSYDFPYIEMFIKLHEQRDFIELEKQIDFIRWNKIEELTEYSYFDFDKIAAYVIKFSITDRWAKYSTERGNELFLSKIKEMGHSIKFSKEFEV
jgi:hypothetical protein